MRLFVAIYPPPEALDDIVAQTKRLRIGAAAEAGINVRLAARSALHVTVAFIGEVDDARLPTVEEALDRVVQVWQNPPRRHRRTVNGDRGAKDAGHRVPALGGAGHPVPDPEGGVETGGSRAFRLQLGGGGRFGRGRCTVLWVGLLGEVGALHRLVMVTRRELRRARLPYDLRPMRPHLTLARPGDRVDPESLDEDLRSLDGYLGPSWPAAELVLVRSHHGPRSTHDRLAAWPL